MVLRGGEFDQAVLEVNTWEEYQTEKVDWKLLNNINN